MPSPRRDSDYYWLWGMPSEKRHGILNLPSSLIVFCPYLNQLGGSAIVCNYYAFLAYHALKSLYCRGCVKLSHLWTLTRHDLGKYMSSLYKCTLSFYDHKSKRFWIVTCEPRSSQQCTSIIVLLLTPSIDHFICLKCNPQFHWFNHLCLDNFH